jgi:parvulin-like peptidyl-prolyl isomerase
MNKISLAALALLGLTGTASASDALPSRAVAAFGVALASQGDAALTQIRRELTQSALEAMKPFPPAPQKAPEQPPLAVPPAAQH